MTVSATIDPRPLDYRDQRPCGIQLAEGLRESLKVPLGATVRVTTEHGRSVLCQVLAQAERIDEDTVRVDRFTRQALKAFPYESVSIEHTTPGTLRELTLVPAVKDLGVHAGSLAALARATLVATEVAVRPGMLLYARSGPRSGGVLFEVHAVDAEGSDGGIATESTTIWIAEADHHHDGASPHQHLAASDLTDSSTTLLTTFEDVGGLSRQIQEAREYVLLPLVFPEVYRQLGINTPRGVLFHGAPGTGKTLLARSLASEVNAGLFIVNGPDIVGTYSGETESNLRRLFADATLNSPSIILVDEIDSIAPFRRRATGPSDARAVAQLLALMDGLASAEGVLLVGTTNRIESIDPALRRAGRFDREVYLPPPDAEGREQILRIHTREMPLSDAALAELRGVAAQAHGFVGADLMELAREAGLSALRRAAADFLAMPTIANSPSTDGLFVEAADLHSALAKVSPSALRDAPARAPSVSWEDIGGLEETKRRLSDLLNRRLRAKDRPDGNRSSASDGVVLHGPPGVGKSLLVEAAARAAGMSLIPVHAPELFSPWLGESEERVRELFGLALRTRPCIILLDQLDAILPGRASADQERSTGPQRVAHQVLKELDTVAAQSDVVVIGVTDRIELVDRAALRPGRLGTHLRVDLPDESERAEILRIHLRDLPVEGDIAAITRELSGVTAGASGAQLAAICHEAAFAATAEGVDAASLRGRAVTEASLRAVIETARASWQREWSD